MSQILCRSLTTAVLVCAAGIPLSAKAEPLAQEAIAHPQAQVESAIETVEVSATEALLPSGLAASSDQEDAELSEMFDIFAHTVEDDRVAVLFIDSLPVLTFFEQAAESTTQKASADLAATVTADPVVRAEQVAQQIDQFYQTAGNAETIQVRWDADLEEYVVSLNGAPLVLINEATIYANTTGELGEDALHATNRLRTLLGGAEPLTEVEGRPQPPPVAPTPSWGVTSVFSGQASWYGPGFHGRRTASGEAFNQNALTAAHRTLPFGTMVRVTNVHNNRQVIVRINDRGPFSHGRVLDLSAGAARQIGLDRAGVGPVRVEVLSQ